MKITEIEIRICKTRDSGFSAHHKGIGTGGLDFLFISMRTDEGLEGRSMGFGGRSGRMTGYVAEAIRPFFLGKDALDREKHWQEYRIYDRFWNHAPIYGYGPFDICLWDIAAQKAGLPLYKYLGAYRDRVPVYGTSLLLNSPQAYADEALAVQRKGWHAYKVHPVQSGDMKLDLEAYRLCREAVGPDFKLMLDCVGALNHEQALCVGRELEKLNYHWLEEPLFDTDLHGLRELTRQLDIAIASTEVIPGSQYLVAEWIASRAVDIVRADPSWKGGVTPTLRIAHLAEAFGMNCEIHSGIYHPLEVVNLHCCCAIKNSELFELLVPTDHFSFGLKTPIKIDDQGYALPPHKPGIGCDYDMDLIDRCTVDVL